jgi:hypothetical protein
VQRTLQQLPLSADHPWQQLGVAWPSHISFDDEVMATRWNHPGMVMSLVGGLADRQRFQRISAIPTTSRARYARCVAGANLQHGRIPLFFDVAPT